MHALHLGILKRCRPKMGASPAHRALGVRSVSRGQTNSEKRFVASSPAAIIAPRCNRSFPQGAQPSLLA